MEFVFLGTGTSVGVPQIGCKCRVCTSSDPRDRRRRCGAYLKEGSLGVLIDTPPEMRLSCCELSVDKVDAIVLTHAHMDHVAGFDDIRRFNTINGRKVEVADDSAPGGVRCKVEGKIMPVYAMPETEAQIHQIFPYISDKGGLHGLYRPQVKFVNDDKFLLEGDSGEKILVTRLKVEHLFPCSGYLFVSNSKSLAYISDCHALPEETIESISGVDVLVLNCLRDRPHPTHLNTELALCYSNRIRAKKTYFTHMCHDFSHSEWLERLPDGIAPAYDGLTVEI